MGGAQPAIPLNGDNVDFMRFLRHGLVVWMLATTLLSGCAVNPANDDAMQTKAEGIVLGTAGSMAAHSLLGSVVGGRRKRVRFERAVDIVFGGSGGYVLGATVAERKQRYANEEDRLNGEIRLFNLQNERLSAYNAGTSKEIADLQKKLDAIESGRESARRRVSFSLREQQAYAKKIEKDKANTVKLASELSALEEYLHSVQGTGDQSKVAALRQEIEALQKNTAALESNNRQMNRLVAAMPVRN